MAMENITACGLYAAPGKIVMSKCLKQHKRLLNQSIRKMLVIGIHT